MEENEQILIGFDYGMAAAEVIEVLVDDIEDPATFDEIARANAQRPEILNILLQHPETPQSVRDYIAGVMQVPVPIVKPVEKTEEVKEMRRESLTTKLQRLSVSARIQLALKGGREIRGILSKDPNKLVMLSVLENGKITTSEIEMLVKSRTVLEEALRRISRNREWMRVYGVVQGLVTNPKTPAGVAISFVSDLKTKDLIILEKNKNVADAIRAAAKRLLASRKPK